MNDKEDPINPGETDKSVYSASELIEFGRPTKYHPGLCKEIIDFFNKKMFEYDEDAQTVMPTMMPTFERFAVDIGVCTATLRLWKEKHKDFSAAYKVAKDCQKNNLIYHGLLGTYNPAFAKFVAINCTDMVDKVETTIDQTTIQINVDQQDTDL